MSENEVIVVVCWWNCRTMS